MAGDAVAQPSGGFFVGCGHAGHSIARHPGPASSAEFGRWTIPALIIIRQGRANARRILPKRMGDNVLREALDFREG